MAAAVINAAGGWKDPDRAARPSDFFPMSLGGGDDEEQDDESLYASVLAWNDVLGGVNLTAGQSGDADH